MSELPPSSTQVPEIVLARPARPTPWRPPSSLELASVSTRDAQLDLWLVVLTALLVPLGFQVVATWQFGEPDVGPERTGLLVIQKWFDLLLACGLLAYLSLRHRLGWVCFGIRRDRLGGQLLWSLGSLAATYAWMAATVIFLGTLVVLFPQLEDDMLERTRTFDLMPVHDYLRTVLLLVPVAAHEEIVFRALLLPYLRRLTHAWWPAVLVSSGIFAALHFDQGWLGVLQILGVGTVLSVFFILSRSLLTVTLAHFAFNFLQFQLIRLLPEGL